MSSSRLALFSSVIAKVQSKPAIFVLGVAISVGLGSIIVKAADNPMIRDTINEFNRPIRRAVEHYIPRGSIELPRIFQSRERSARAMPTQSQGVQQGAPRYIPNSRMPMEIALPGATLPTADGEGAPRADSYRTRRVKKLDHSGTVGLASGTNYCVRLCDGFAFPMGRADGTSTAGQEAACQLACPGSETALYSAPQGAKDIDAAMRAGRPYTALPTAFRYREVYDKTCACRAVGETQSPAALLTDFTLRRGDIVMTRIGMRHFDGNKSFPHRAAAFSDALRRVTDKREVALLRGMEAASLRGVLPSSAHASIRARVISEIKQSERVAITQVAAASRGSRGFEVMRPRPTPVGNGPVRVIDRRVGLVALN